MKKIEIMGLNEYIYYGKCDNGLEVYVWPNQNLRTNYMTLSVKYGSIHTSFKVNNKEINVPNGTAHFLEHVKFNEKNGVTAHDFFQKTGASTNAFTTFEYTSYLVEALDNVEDNLIHLIDFVQTPYFTNKMIQKEKGIIIEEANMGMDNSYSQEFFGVNKALFKNCNYRNNITGQKKDINQITLKDIKNAYNYFYTPDNMFLIVTGNINPYEIFEIVKANQNRKIVKQLAKPVVITAKEPLKVNKKQLVVKGNITTPTGDYAIKLSRTAFKDYSDFEINTYVDLLLKINFDSTSLFKDELISNKLITSLSFSNDIVDNFVVIRVRFDSKYPEEIIKKVKDKFNNLELNEDDFNRKKKVLVSNIITKFESAELANDFIQLNLINYNDLLSDIKNKLQNLSFQKLNNIKNLIITNNSIEYITMPKQH